MKKTIKPAASAPAMNIEETQRVLRECIETSKQLTERSQELLARQRQQAQDPSPGPAG